MLFRSRIAVEDIRRIVANGNSYLLIRWRRAVATVLLKTVIRTWSGIRHDGFSFLQDVLSSRTGAIMEPEKLSLRAGGDWASATAPGARLYMALSFIIANTAIKVKTPEISSGSLQKGNKKA